MEKHEDVVSILSKIDLHDVEEIVSQPYHWDGPGRPPRSPLGIFKALVVKQLRTIPNDRELYRRLWNDEALREICDIEEHEKPYHPSQLTRFRNRVGPERLEVVMNSFLEELVEGGIIKGETLALDAIFIEAYSRRDTADDSRGLSDPEARVGRDGKTYDLGYKAHLAVDVDSDMPLAVVGASANENEKRHVEELLG
jgi:transposase